MYICLAIYTDVTSSYRVSAHGRAQVTDLFLSKDDLMYCTRTALESWEYF
jgi:hypothetical protein